MPNYRGLALRRHGWPKGSEDPDVRLEWHRERVRFSEGDLICGVRTSVERYRHPFAKETCPNHPRQNPWWPAYTTSILRSASSGRVTTSRDMATALWRLLSLPGRTWLRWSTKRSLTQLMRRLSFPRSWWPRLYRLLHGLPWAAEAVQRDHVKSDYRSPGPAPKFQAGQWSMAGRIRTAITSPEPARAACHPLGAEAERRRRAAD